jgi:hypothetical protein
MDSITARTAVIATGPDRIPHHISSNARFERARPRAERLGEPSRSLTNRIVVMATAWAPRTRTPDTFLTWKVVEPHRPGPKPMSSAPALRGSSRHSLGKSCGNVR